MLKEQLTRGNVVVDIVIDEAEACRPVEIYINGIKANFYDLGRTKDICPEKAPPCGCGNRVFTPKELKEFTLKKYKLTKDDVKDLNEILVEKFSIGFCRRCK